MRILGLSAYYHDSAAAMVEDGRILAAAQEERFTRIKHDAGFPDRALAFCLESAGCTLDDVDHIAFYDKPFLTFERLLETYLAFAPRGFRSFSMALPIWVKDKLFQKRELAVALKAHGRDPHPETRLLFTEHHQSHGASAFYPSPFQEAAVLTLDGVGEWATGSLGLGSGRDLKILKEMHFPHSLGLLYSAFTSYTGFKVNSGEYKVMGLAPYGEPRYAKLIFEHLMDLKDDGSFRLDLDHFDYCTGLTMTNERFDALFGGPPRGEGERLDQRHMDLAASIQAVTEEVVLRLGRSIARDTGQKNLCLAGGVALNCVANGKLLRAGIFDHIWIQPAAGDAGGALGAALAAYHWHLGQERRPPQTPNAQTSDAQTPDAQTLDAQTLDAMSGAYLGPAYDDQEIQRRLTAAGARFEVLEEDALLERTAGALAAGEAVGWFQGAMEFGPRALGNRSILGDARSPAMQKTLNLKVKYRESFRPFAPSCLAEEVGAWFELDRASPYMLLVADVKESRRRSMSAEEQALFGIDKLNVARSEVPAVTHVDYSARVQSVHRETNPKYHALISRFHAATGCPLIVNTSFNVRGEPIVATPDDAFRCFMGTELDVLAIGNCFLQKTAQDPALKQDYKDAFGPD